MSKIHKGFDFSQNGGFPINQQRLEYMQSAYSDLSQAFASLIGDNVIVSGCVTNGTNVSDGWICVGGELLPFVGSPSQTTFLIRETKTPLFFQDGQNKEVQFSRFAQFGTGVDAKQWSGLSRLKLLKDLSKLPTRFTDNPKVSDSDILATSKAVNSTFNKATAITIEIGLGNETTVFKGEYKLNVTDLFNPQTLRFNYSLFQSQFSARAINDFGIVGTFWLQGNDAIGYELRRTKDSPGGISYREPFELLLVKKDSLF